MTFETKLSTLECRQDFFKIWPRNLVFDQTWPGFKLDLDIMMIDILTQFHERWIKTVPSRVLLCTQGFLRFDLAA